LDRLTRTLILLVLPLGLMSQDLSWNLGLKSNLGRGEQVGDEYNYFENFINLSLERDQWYLDLSFESSQPPEYGFEYQGLDRFFLSYIGDTRSLEIGDISAVFGRGLALNLDEDQAIDFDNELLGLRFSSMFLENHELDIIGGVREEYRFYSPSSNLREPDGRASYELLGAEVTLNSASGGWSLSPYFIGSHLASDLVWQSMDLQTGTLSRDTLTQNMNALQAGWGQNYYGNNWDIYLEYSKTLKALDYPLATQSLVQTEGGQVLENGDVRYALGGQALNIQVNWFPEWFTAMFEYKRYLSGRETAAEKRNPMLLASKPLPWQLGPTGIREHDISLLGNVTHPVDYGDELGWNLEIRKPLGERWNMVFNAARTSQSVSDAEPGLLPVNDLEKNPWQEAFAEFEYAGDQIYQRMLVAFTRSVLSGQSAAEVAEHITFVPAYFSWHPNSSLVLSTVAELQRSKVFGERYDGQVLEGHHFNSGHFILSADYDHKYSTALIWDTSSDPSLLNPGEELQHWVSGEISLKPLDGLWVRASYGKEKGGVRCTGGVCRVLNPFEGLRLSMEWRL